MEFGEISVDELEGEGVGIWRLGLRLLFTGGWPRFRLSNSSHPYQVVSLGLFPFSLLSSFSLTLDYERE